MSKELKVTITAGGYQEVISIAGNPVVAARCMSIIADALQDPEQVKQQLVSELKEVESSRTYYERQHATASTELRDLKKKFEELNAAHKKLTDQISALSTTDKPCDAAS